MSWFLESQHVIPAEHVIPPFVAEGRLVTREFRTERTNLNYRTDATVVFLYSNGWWQVEARYQYVNQYTGITNVEDCMKIPDGCRSYIIFQGSTNKGTTTASACPMAFPPPGKTELLVPWLSLCPHPELPLINDKRMRRFISLPDCRPNIFNAPQNEGFYDVKYLAPENAFLSELVIRNNGFSVELTVVQNGGVEGEIKRYPAPYENGFPEFQYRVVQTTNLYGMTFPLRAVCKHSSPNWGSKNRDDLRVCLSSELIVTRISFSENEVARRIAAPAELMAFDARPPYLPKKVTVNYLVQDDQWKPISDPEIERWALSVREANGGRTESSK